MSADLLRRAAEKLREHATAATPGPWEVRQKGYPHIVWQGDPDAFQVISTNLAGNVAPDSEFIALMHPPVALALAELLDDMADLIEVFPRDDEMAGTQKLVALARTILREPQ